jgi:Baseplate J-like protein
MTAVYTYITDTGTIVEDTTDLLTDVQGEWTAALGSALDLEASTPQGTLIAAETLARTNVMKNNADLANVINPNLSYGVYLDAICALTGMTRGQNMYTTCSGVSIAGNASTSIPAGNRVQTENGDIFTIQSAVAIASNGTATATIQSQELGDIPVPTGRLTILDGVIGWGSATVLGTSLTTPGTLALTDPQLKNARIQQLATLGVGSSAALVAAASAVPGVTSVQVVENNTGAVGTVNGVTFTLPNAMWICVAGNPTAAQVAQALYNAHNGGCPWDFGGAGMGTPVNSPNGTAATDPATGLTYNVKFTTPILYDCYVNITVHQGQSSSSPAQAVQNAIMQYATGQEEGEVGLVVGADVSAFEMAGAVARQLPGLYVKACSVACVTHGSAAPAYPGGYSTEVIMNNFQQAVLQTGNITVQIV